jgi:DNA modification methylase
MQRQSFRRPPLGVMATTLWEYPSQHYDWVDDAGVRHTMQGDKDYVGATPSWVIWQLLKRYTREGDTVIDPMCGSGTTLDVAASLGRKSAGFDLVPRRDDVQQSDARKLPLPDASVDFAFVDPPYSTHIDYSQDPRCIGKLDAAGDDGGRAYYAAMRGVIGEMHRVMRNRRYMGLYVSDSWKKKKGGPKGSGAGTFMPIGFELFAIMREKFVPVDIVAVVRQNQKLDRGNWRKAAVEENFFLRGFNYLFIMKKVDDVVEARQGGGAGERAPRGADGGKASVRPADRPRR